MSLQDLMRRMRHLPVQDQVDNLNTALHGHYAYYGSREFPGIAAGASRSGALPAQNALQPELGRSHYVGCIPPDQRAASVTASKLYLPYRELQALAVL
jgi:hypothetical protein